jgi:hypothetical protein
MSQSQTSNVIQSLENVRERVKQRLTKVAEYRAFLAIEKPIAEVADIPDLRAHLETAKEKILDRLKQTREYQALLTVEKAIKEISEVLEVVGDDGHPDAAPAAVAAPVSLEKTPTAITRETAVVGLAALVQDSFSAQLANELRSAGDDKLEAEKAKVA